MRTGKSKNDFRSHYEEQIERLKYQALITLNLEAQRKSRIALGMFCEYWRRQNGVAIEPTGHMTFLADISFLFREKNLQSMQDVSLVRITRNGYFEGYIWLEGWGFIYPEFQFYSYNELDTPDHSLTVRVYSEDKGTYRVVITPR